MCMGIPMKVVEEGMFQCLCEDAKGNQQHIDVMLTGEQPVGTWLLTFLGAAREVIDETTAAQIIDALSALEEAMQGGTDLDQYFPDLTAQRLN